MGGSIKAWQILCNSILLNLWLDQKAQGVGLQEHFSDHYVQKAQKEGLRSRASYKLMDIQKKYKLIKPNQVIVDLGAAPGGWSELARKWVGRRGRVVALDVLAMDPIHDVDFIQGDFTEEAVLGELSQLLEGAQVDVVLSDMAPNMSGVKAVDQAKSMYLCELALEFAQTTEAGAFICKLFQGEGFDQYLQELRKFYKKVHMYKPDASRGRSREVYAVCIR